MDNQPTIIVNVVLANVMAVTLLLYVLTKSVCGIPDPGSVCCELQPQNFFPEDSLEVYTPQG